MRILIPYLWLIIPTFLFVGFLVYRSFLNKKNKNEVDGAGIYFIKGRQFRLKREFTVADLEALKTIDSFFEKTEGDKGKLEVLQSTTKEEFSNFLKAVLIPPNDFTVTSEFFHDVNINIAVEIYTDFFFVYLKSNIDSAMRLTKLEKRAKLFAKTLNI